MRNISISNKDQIVMSLVHYFVTKKDYAPIVVQGAKDEIWLENLSGPYKVIRINTKYIHNDEQHELDLKKVKHVIKQIKRKTLSFKINTLNICVDMAQRVQLTEKSMIETVSLNSLNEMEKNKTIKYAFPDIKSNIINKADNLDLLVDVTNDINKKTEKNNKHYENIFKPKKLIITYALIGICILMYLITAFLSNNLITANNYVLVFLGANFGLLVQEGEVWRFISSIFLHGNIIHIMVNMYSLFIIGSQLETFLGKLKFTGIYLVSGITGSILSSIINDPSIPSVGASGAIFGLLGALLYFGYHYRMYLSDVLRKQIVPLIILNLLIGFSISGIDNFAHIGGLIGGYLSAAAFGLKGKSTFSEQRNAIIALILLLGFMIYMIFR